MISAWFAAPPSVQTVTAVAAALLIAFGLGGERGLWRRGGTPLARWGRIVAWSAAVLSASLLVLRPLGPRAGGASAAVLVTDGAAPEAADSRVLAGAPLFTLTGATGASNATAIPDARTLWRRQPGLEELTVRGYGLDAWDWGGFTGRVSFVPSAPPAGFVSASWPRRIGLGDALRVEGRYFGPGLAKVVLEGPGGMESEQVSPVVSREATAVRFVLRGVPRAIGRTLYRLRALDAAGHELAGENVDVVVESPRLASVLVLESAPRFETRYLKDWLAGAGGIVAVRSVISKDRVRVEAPAGGAPAMGKRLDAQALDAFDVGVADAAALSTLSPTERDTLRGAIDRGLGLVVALPRSSASGSNAPLPSTFGAMPAVAKIADLDLLSARPTWPGASLPTLDIEARELSDEGEPLVEDASGRRLAVAYTVGGGRVAWTLLHDTYRWILEGNAAAHRALWSRLLSAVSRPDRGTAGRFRPPSGPVLVDRPLELILDAGAPQPQARLIEIDGEPLALAPRQDELDPSRWTVSVWPRHAGWFRVENPGGLALEIYAAPTTAWPAWRADQRQTATLRRAVSGAARSGAPATSAPRMPMSRWPFFTLLLVGLGWLWVDERLRG